VYPRFIGSPVTRITLMSNLDHEGVCYVLRRTDTLQIRRVPESDMWYVRHDTDTHNYTKLCDFLKLLAVTSYSVRIR